MTTQPGEAAETAPQETTNEAPTPEQKPTETVDFWKEKAREQEKRAKANASAAARLAEIEESQKSEAQKAQEALTAAAARADAAEAKALSLQIATEHKLGSEDATLLASLPDEDSMRALAKRLAGQVEERKKQGNHVASEGTSGGAKSSTGEQFASFFENTLGG